MSDNKLLHASGIEKVKGHLAMLLFAAFISGSFSIGHMAAPFIAPEALTAARFIVAAVLMSVLGVILFGHLPVITESLWRFVILGSLMATYFVLMFFALQIASPVSTGAMFTLIPLMSAIFSYMFMRQRTAPVVLVALFIGACGAIWVIFRGDLQAILRFEIGRGEAIFFVGCIAHAAYTPLVRKLNRGEPVFRFSLMTLFASAFVMAIWGAPKVVDTDWTNLPDIVWITVGYLALFTTAGTLFLLQFASLRLPASKVMAYGYLTPGFIVLYEWLLGHGLTNATLLFGVFVTAAALVVLALTSDN